MVTIYGYESLNGRIVRMPCTWSYLHSKQVYDYEVIIGKHHRQTEDESDPELGRNLHNTAHTIVLSA